MFGSILRIGVEIDVTKPLRHSLLLSFQGTEAGVDLLYEKLHITCFICGIIGHMEEQCVQFNGKNEDDCSKPYGRWFQNDVLAVNYRRPQGKRFGLDPSQGWSMKTPMYEEEMENTSRTTMEELGLVKEDSMEGAVGQSING